MPPEDRDDSNLTLSDIVKRQGNKGSKGKQVFQVFGDLAKSASKDTGGHSQKEMPMITLKHRWMRNRNVVVGTTIFSFDKEGVAKVLDMSNASLDAQVLVKQSNGLVTLVEEKVEPTKAEPVKVKAEEVQEKKVDPPKPEPVKAKAEEVQEKAEVDPESDAQEAASDFASKQPPRRKTPPGKR